MDSSTGPDLASINLSSQISIRVVKTAQDVEKQEGDAAVALIQAAAEAGKQMSGDNGLGGRLNVTA